MFRYLRKVLYVISGRRSDLIFLLAFFVLASTIEAVGVSLIGPFLIVVGNPSIVFSNQLASNFFSFLNVQTDSHIVLTSGILLIFLFTFKTVIYFVSRVYIKQYGYKQKSILEERLLDSYLGLPYVFHLNRNSADLVQNIANETIQFSTVCLLPLLELISNLITTFILLIILARTDIVLLILIAIIFLPVILLFHLLGKYQKSWGKRATLSQKSMIRSVNHALGGLKEIKVVGCEEYFRADLRQYSHEFYKVGTFSSSVHILPRILMEALLIVSIVVYVLISYLTFGKDIGQLTSIMGVFAVASIRLLPAMSQMIQSVNKIQGNSYSLGLIYSDLKEIEKFRRETKIFSGSHKNRNFNTPSIQSGTKYLRFENLVELDDLTYSYPKSSRLAINNISFRIKKGESVALIGKSGSGKTTLVDIFLGLLTPKAGDIKVDGVSVYSNLREWQGKLGYIPQSIFLLDDTIEHNVAFGVPARHIDQTKLWAAIEAAQLKEFVLDLPDGIKTSVGERGVMLSGGQRQRIGIARALYHDCEILVLDEATSALDTETEDLISNAINSLAGSKTLVVIAHRYSTIKDCDTIYRLEEGKIVQCGTYEEVILAK
jgi:ABC-type multidrug transport system fused ATPase/permease subunit